MQAALWWGEQNLKSTVVNCSNYTPLMLLPRLWWSHLNWVATSQQGSRNSWSIIYTLLWLLNSPAQRDKPDCPKHSEVSQAPSVKWNMRLLQQRDTRSRSYLGSPSTCSSGSCSGNMAELTCCTELWICWGYLFPQKHLPEGSGLAQAWLSRVSFTIWNCKL